MHSYDVIVAGVGAMGGAAFDHLAGRGVRVLGIDPWGVAHGQGSSGGETRLIRKAYFEHPDYVPLLERAYHNWRALEQDSGQSLLHETGTLYLGPPDCDLISGSRRAAASHGLALETVDDWMLGERFPLFRRPQGYEALFEPEAGFLLSGRAVRAQITRGIHHGADLISDERVLSWRAEPGSVTVTTERDTYTAGALVLASGAWSGRLLADLELTLDVTRQVLFWLQPAPALPFTLDHLPCWAVQRPDAPGLFYGFPALPPALSDQPGAKLAQHHPGRPQDPDAAREPPAAAERHALLAAVQDFLPDLHGPVTGSRTCLYTMSADGHFIVDRHPAHANVVLACGFSGHGFKFAPVIGEALADLVLDGATRLPIEFLGLR